MSSAENEYEGYLQFSKVIRRAISKMSFLANLLAERSKSRLIAPCIYTTGFAGKDFALLPDLLNFLDAVLIDVRFAPTNSQEIQWRKDYLKLLLKDRYRHVPHLGNRLSKESGQQAIQNLSLGIKIIAELKANLLLMCQCPRIEECHRAIISRSLKKQGIETEEISDWNSPSQY
jgi:uncharacterized protein (DUF488 family)